MESATEALRLSRLKDSEIIGQLMMLRMAIALLLRSHPEKSTILYQLMSTSSSLLDGLKTDESEEFQTAMAIGAAETTEALASLLDT